MTRRQTTGIVRQDVETLRRVRAWLDTQDGNALERDVVDDLIERVEAHAKTAALIRIRVKNAGTPPSERQRQAARIAGQRNASADTRTLPGELWTVPDLERLRQLVERDHSDEEIAEFMGRTPEAVHAKRRKLGIKQRDHRYRFSDADRRAALMGNRGRQIRPETPYQRAQRVVRERRAAGGR